MEISYHIKKAVYKICYGGVLLSISGLILADEDAAPGDWAKNFAMAGVVEVAASMGDDPAYSDGDVSDIVAATLELAIDAEMSDTVIAHVQFLFEEDDTPYEVDESYIEIAIGDTMSITAGQMYVPFGAYESHMLSFPLTLELGETRESAVLLSMDSGAFQGGAYLFNGDVEETPAKNNEVEHLGLSARLAIVSESMTLDLGFDYIDSIADSDGISAALADLNPPAAGNPVILTDTPSAIILHAVYRRGPITGIFEYLSADSFNIGDYSVKGNAAELTAMNVELGYEIESMGRPATVAISLQTTEDAVGILPEQRLLVGFSTELDNGITIGIEYSSSEDYATSDTYSLGAGAATGAGTGKDATVITGQMAIEF